MLNHASAIEQVSVEDWGTGEHLRWGRIVRVDALDGDELAGELHPLGEFLDDGLGHRDLGRPGLGERADAR